MTEHKDIHDAMLGIYGEVGYVQKQRSPELRYTYAGEAAFISELRPAMINHGVTVSVSKMCDLTQETYTTAKGTTMMRATIHAVVTFHHVSGTSLMVESYGEGSDSGDKAINKAMTDAYKYALRQTFMIETGDDPDKDASQERSTNYTKNHEQPKQAYQAKPDNGNGSSGNQAMTYEQACNMKSSDKTLYGNCTNAELEGKKIGILKALKGDVDAVKQSQYQNKLDAIKVLLAVPEPERMKRAGQIELTDTAIESMGLDA